MSNNDWKVRDIVIPDQVVIVPMAGISNPVFRVICKEFGAGLVYTEMILDRALCYDNEGTVGMTDVREQEHPLTMQIFEHDIEIMVYTAKFLDEKTDCNIVDINMGCPVIKIVKSSAGSTLMKSVDHVVEMSRAVVQSVKKSVIVKMRIGWDMDQITCLKLARGLESIGVQALAMHGRTREQMYEGCAGWSYIKKMKETVSIPVMGNGDMRSGEDAERMLKETGYDAVMIGRGALRDPWLIRDIAYYLECGRHMPEVTLEETFAIARLRAKRLCNLKGEFVGIREMREHTAWYVKGLPRGHQLRDQLSKIETYEEIQSMLSVYEAEYARIQEQCRQGSR